MRIAVALSGPLRVAACSARVELSLEGERPTLAAALDALCSRYPQTRRYLRHATGAKVSPGVRVLLNDARLDDEPPADEVLLRDGDRLALLMPVVGG